MLRFANSNITDSKRCLDSAFAEVARMTMETSTSTASVNNNHEEKHKPEEEMQTENTAEPSSPPPRVPSPMIMVEDDSLDATPRSATTVPPIAKTTPTATTATTTTTQTVLLTPTRDRKKSSPGPSSAAQPRQRKRSQPVRGDLLPDPDKLLSYKHHDKKHDEELEDPTVPGGQPKPPPEPRQPGQGAERKRSTVTFCPVIQTIEK